MVVGNPNNNRLSNPIITSEAVVPEIRAWGGGVEPVVGAVKGSLLGGLADEVDVGLVAAATLVAPGSGVIETQSNAVTHYSLKSLACY